MTTLPDSLYQMGGVPVGGLLTQGNVYHFVSSPIPHTAGGKALAAT